MTPAGERGSVTIWMAGLAAVVLVLSGLSVDAWQLVAERRRLAAVADAAALAGSSAVDREAWSGRGVAVLVPSEACALARSLASHGVDRFECAVAGASIRVEVERRVPPALLSLVHPDPVPVSARATAEASPRR